MRRLLTRGGAFALALVAVPCASFDTGLHSTLTRESMLQEGFELGPTNMGVVMNWLVDYYASSDVTNKRVHAECEKLHFDNLFLTKSVANYWDRLAVNAERGCKQAVREGDPYRLLSLIGMSLHAVQDFYTHSNWLDYYPPAPTEEYQTVSWWDDAKRTEKLVYTGGYPTHRYCASLGHVQDDESGYGTDNATDQGLIYMRARYYDPETGRFISEDPARDGWTWYAYANNDPIKYADPSGKDADLLWIAVSLISFIDGSGQSIYAFLALGQLASALLRATDAGDVENSWGQFMRGWSSSPGVERGNLRHRESSIYNRILPFIPLLYRSVS